MCVSPVLFELGCRPAGGLLGEPPFFEENENSARQSRVGGDLLKRPYRFRIRRDRFPTGALKYSVWHNGPPMQFRS